MTFYKELFSQGLPATADLLEYVRFRT